MQNKNIKFIFFGTPNVASQTLEILKTNGYIPEVIITSQDKASGRGLVMSPTETALWANQNNIKCLKPERITDELVSDISKYNCDLFIVVAYGKILPEKLINTPELGTINIHYSLLPKYRGASPLEACLLNGDEVTGISIQQMEYKLDSGPILLEKKLLINVNEEKESIRNKLIEMGATSLCEILPEIKERKTKPEVQNETNATFCKKIKKEDGEINLNSNPKENWNKYRAYSGWPGTFFFTEKKGRKIRVKVKEAKYEDNLFVIKRVIPEGRKEISYDEFLKWN